MSYIICNRRHVWKIINSKQNSENYILTSSFRPYCPNHVTLRIAVFSVMSFVLNSFSLFIRNYQSNVKFTESIIFTSRINQSNTPNVTLLYAQYAFLQVNRINTKMRTVVLSLWIMWFCVYQLCGFVSTMWFCAYQLCGFVFTYYVVLCPLFMSFWNLTLFCILLFLSFNVSMSYVVLCLPIMWFCVHCIWVFEIWHLSLFYCFLSMCP